MHPMTEPFSLHICPLPGYASGVGHLVSLMEWARRTTMGTVRNLTMEQLDHLHDEQSNSIGALLTHVAAIEYFFGVMTFENRSLTRVEFDEWHAGLELSDLGRRVIRGKPLAHYIALLERTRTAALQALSHRDDAWLYAEIPFWGRTANNYFVWFHAVEDEIAHRGQMRWLRKRLPVSAE